MIMISKIIYKKVLVLGCLFIIFIFLCLMGYSYWLYAQGQYTTPPPLDSLEKKIISNGDIHAYHTLCWYYPKAELHYSFIMVNQYDYLPACINIYTALMCSLVDMTYNPDPKTAQIAMEYLKYAADKKDNEACLILSEEYMLGSHIKKDTVEGLRYFFYHCHCDSIYYNKRLPAYKKMLYERVDDEESSSDFKVTPMKFRNNPYY